MFSALIGLLLTASIARALDGGLTGAPAMGYNTWNDLRCDGVTEGALIDLADRLVELGLVEAGYIYLNMDDCWAIGLDGDGRLVPDPVGFPRGIKPVADYIHGKGMKFGLYGCRGLRTCAFRPGSGGLEAVHATQFAEWGVDYLKVWLGRSAA